MSIFTLDYFLFRCCCSPSADVISVGCTLPLFMAGMGCIPIFCCFSIFIDLRFVLYCNWNFDWNFLIMILYIFFCFRSLTVYYLRNCRPKSLVHWFICISFSFSLLFDIIHRSSIGLFRGEVFAMSGGQRHHNPIACQTGPTGLGDTAEKTHCRANWYRSPGQHRRIDHQRQIEAGHRTARSHSHRPRWLWIHRRSSHTAQRHQRAAYTGVLCTSPMPMWCTEMFGQSTRMYDRSSFIAGPSG